VKLQSSFIISEKELLVTNKYILFLPGLIQIVIALIAVVSRERLQQHAG
jgi:hypothetical protein